MKGSAIQKRTIADCWSKKHGWKLYPETVPKNCYWKETIPKCLSKRNSTRMLANVTNSLGERERMEMPVVMLSYEMLLKRALKSGCLKLSWAKFSVRNFWPKQLQKICIEKARIKLRAKKTTVQERCPNHAKKSLLNKSRIKIIVKKLLYNCVVPNNAKKTLAKNRKFWCSF